ncbi:TauD/TfdA family dioxygenase, partial [Streptomyces hirsutus]
MTTGGSDMDGTRNIGRHTGGERPAGTGPGVEVRPVAGHIGAEITVGVLADDRGDGEIDSSRRGRLRG